MKGSARMDYRGSGFMKNLFSRQGAAAGQPCHSGGGRSDLGWDRRRPERGGSVAVGCLLFIAVVFPAILSCMLLTGDNSWIYGRNAFFKVSLVGEYRVDDGGWLPLRGGGLPYLSSARKVEIRGHFTKEIEKNLAIALRIQYLRVRIFKNGKELLSFGEASSRHRLSKSGGDVWWCLLSPGITPADKIEMELYNVYGNRYLPSAEKLLGNIYYGTEGALYRSLFAERGLAAAFALFMLMIGLLELTSAIFFFLLHGHNSVALVYNAGYTVFSAAWFFIQNDISFLLPTTAFTAYMEILSMYMTLAFFALYVSEYMTGRRRSAVRLISAAALLTIAALSMRQLFGGTEVYETLNISTLLTGTGLVAVIAILAAEAVKSSRKMPRLILFSTVLIPMGAVYDAYVYVFTPGRYAIYMQMGSIISAVILGGVFIYEYKNKMEIAARVEHMQNELTQSRVAIMVSQIQPHFIYNALATIKALCEIYPESAQEAIARFSKYLRRNMDSLTAKELIPFEQELTHIENYLYIEKIRFQGKVNFIYDIKAVDFFLPPLSVQPLVENALRYGVAAVNGGGTVGISTEENAGGYLVRVRDNGKGFDFMNIPRDDRNHVGIENVKNRIEMMCGGTLSIESRPGEGTLVTIFIPKVITDESNRG